MSHPLLTTAIRFFFISLLLILPVKIANACLCTTIPNVLEAYEAADEVLIVRVLSVGTVEGTPVVRPNSDDSHVVIGRVERVYKGSSKVNEQLVFKKKLTSCDWPFDKDSVNKEHLFYLKRPAKPDDRWVATFCTRSTTLEFARDDLLYLDNQEKLRGKTRVSGMYFGTDFSLLNAANRKIRITGSQKAYELYTDKHGVYEIYDLPPGEYRIEMELPTGWKFYGFYPRSTTKVLEKNSRGSGRFVLEAKKHASINMLFLPNNLITGTIVGPNANPLPSLCVYLWKPDHVETTFSCTDERGRFLFESVVPGTYLLVLNPKNEPTSVAPFPRLFYPGTAQREKAILIDVGVGDKLRNMKIVVPAMLETVTVEGEVFLAANEPARDTIVRFFPAKTNGVNGAAQAYTDDKGRFSLRVLKGLAGDVLSETYLSAGMSENCPPDAALAKDSSRKNAQFNTPAIRIEAQHNIRNLVLRFPSRRCETKD